MNVTAPYGAGLLSDYKEETVIPNKTGTKCVSDRGESENVFDHLHYVIVAYNHIV